LESRLSTQIQKLPTELSQATHRNPQVYPQGLKGLCAALLDFGGESQVSVGVSNFPQSVELQQNTNELDYASAGLSGDDVDRLVSEGSERYDELVLLYQSKIADQRRVDVEIGVLWHWIRTLKRF
jgi:hypothetical protein